MRKVFYLGLALLTVGMNACRDDVNLAAVPEAVAGCEAPSDDNLNPEAPMLPGRRCMACHKSSGEAGKLTWSAGGTVYASPTSACNTGGLDGVKVELADETRKIMITLYTNRSGNFFTAETLSFNKLIARVSKDGVYKEMQTPAPSADCPSCHYPGGAAGGRIYLN